MNNTSKGKQLPKVPSYNDWQRLKTLTQEQKQIIAAKEKAMLLQVEETDSLRRENKRLERRLKNARTGKRELKKIIRELVMRSFVLVPETEKDELLQNEGVTPEFNLKLRKTLKYHQ